MKIVIAPDSFKGTLSAREACAAMARGVRTVLADATIVEAPLADGGEGTVDAVLAARRGERRTVRVTGPWGQPVDAAYGAFDDGRRAVIEMAAASGILLAPPGPRDVLRASTFGTGELIRSALDRGADELLVGIGGSATCDGGCGMAQALGVRFRRADGTLLPPGIGGGALADITHIDLSERDARLASMTTRVLCDVTNPLTGPNGAAYVFGPQKGATPDDVVRLDWGLEHLANLIARDVGRSIRDLPGAGAAGGLGAGLVAFANGRLEPGAQTIIAFMELPRLCAGADLLLTGEGSFDAQSLAGKLVSEVAKLGTHLGVRVAVIAGRVELPRERWRGIVSDVAASSATGLENAADAVVDATAAVVRRQLHPA